MVHLALANLRLRKLRTALAVLAVGVGIMTLLTVRGLTEGTIREVADRMKGVRADLLVWDESHHVMMHSRTMSARYGDMLRKIDGVARAVPVLNDSVELGGQPQTVYAVPATDFDLFGGTESLVAGRVFTAGAREVIVDELLASIHGHPLTLGDTVKYADADFTVVGIARQGVVGRVFMPYTTMSELRSFSEPRASMFLVKATGPEAVGEVARQIRRIGLVTISKDNYFEVIARDFKYLDAFVYSTAALTLLVSFLMILLTMFTIVQEQTREVGILRSMGATKARILRLVVGQSLSICAAGVAVGVLLTLAARWGIHRTYPLLTMRLDGELIGTAVVAGLLGGVLGALYPGWRAATVDPVRSLSYE